ncbi:MAG: hypothetical protein RR388_08285, partial [Rikenellaceae bacterium]
MLLKNKFILLFILFFSLSQGSFGKIKYSSNSLPYFDLDGRDIVVAPDDGLWSVGIGWKNDWVEKWVHSSPKVKKVSGDWTILSGVINFPEGDMYVRDSYRAASGSLVRVVRRWEWMGKDTLKKATLSVRFKVEGGSLQPFAPGILYYGNPAGAKINPEIIPVYTGKNGEFAIFEDHRYSMPFFMLENSKDRY